MMPLATTIVHVAGLALVLLVNPLLIYKWGHDCLFTLLVGVPGGVMFLGSFIYFCAKGWYGEIAELERQADLREMKECHTYTVVVKNED